MKINVRYTSPLTKYTNTRFETVEIPDQSTVEDLISRLAERYGDKLLLVFFNEAREFDPLVILSRNGSDFQALDEPLEHGDEIALVAQFAGG